MTKPAADDPREPRQQREAPKRHTARGATGRAKAPREAPPAPPSPAFARGEKVRVTSGPFAGKTGVVQELVGRRSARVMLGLLPVQIDLDDLTPSGAAHLRPRLTSSHRKPVPARS
jgi:transcription antitermination factor NusG